MSKISSLLKVVTSPKRLRSLLSFNEKGYLAEIGWFNSFDTRSPVDEGGNPIPWVTYSFIDFIKGRLNHQHTIFEFGQCSDITVREVFDWIDKQSAQNKSEQTKRY